MFPIKRLKDSLSREFLWSAVKSCGSRKELERVRQYIFKGLEDTRTSEQRPFQGPHWGFFPGLINKAWHDPQALGWTDRLLESFDTIYQDLEKVTAIHAEQVHTHMGVQTPKWNVFYLQTQDSKSTNAGKMLCPKTTSLMASLPDGILRANFSGLFPDGHIKAHCGNTNTRLRLHLGLVCPPGASIRVGHEERAWRKGEFLLFDDSFDHEAWNRGTSMRWILQLDLWHPDLTATERKALDRLNTLRIVERKFKFQDILSDRRACESIKKARTLTETTP